MITDLAHIQLIFNVIAVTGITSLAWIYRILKRDNQKLTGQLEVLRDLGLSHAKITWTPTEIASNHPIPPVETPAPDQDIRQYVSDRMQNWSQLHP